MASPPGRKIGSAMVFTCLLANNFTLGLAYASFGALLSSNEHALGVGRDTVSFGMSALSTTLGLSVLVMGGLVRKLTPRVAIAMGVTAACCALVGLGLTSNLTVALAMWALLGFSAAMAAILGPVAIAAEFYPGRAGKVLAVVNMPLVLFSAPWLVTATLPLLGREGTYFVLAAPLVPVLLLVLRLPSTSDQSQREHTRAASTMPASAILGRGDFWLISLGIALIACTGTAYTVHAMPFAQSRGMSVPESALILSAYSGAGLLGVPVFGWLADRFGAPRTLALSGLVQCLAWAGLAVSPTSSFLVLSAVLGAATTPLTTLHGTAMAQFFGVDGVGKAMGYSFAIKLPFLFAASPVVGYAYVLMADYRPAFLIVAASLVVAMVLLWLSSAGRGSAPRPAMAA